MTNIEIRHAELVRTIREFGTVTRAARELGITQSAASQQLLDLEDRIGRQLFERTRRRMVLTEVGEEFLDRAIPLLREVDALEAYVQHLASGETGTLRVSSDSILCFPWLPGVIRRFRRLHPGVVVHLVQHRDVLHAMTQKKLDVGLTYPRTVPDDLEVHPLFDDEMLAVLPPTHPLTTRSKITPANLSGEDFVYHAELKQSILYRQYLKPNQIELGSFTYIEQPDAILAMVRAGLGITFLPRWSVARDEAAGAVVTRPLRGGRGFRLRWVAMVRRDGEPAFVNDFVEGVRAEAKARE